MPERVRSWICSPFPVPIICAMVIHKDAIHWESDLYFKRQSSSDSGHAARTLTKWKALTIFVPSFLSPSTLYVNAWEGKILDLLSFPVPIICAMVIHKDAIHWENGTGQGRLPTQKSSDTLSCFVRAKTIWTQNHQNSSLRLTLTRQI